MKKIKMLAKTLLSLILFTSSLIFLYRAALLEVLSNKLHIKGMAKQKEENGMNASFSNYLMNSNLLLTEFISQYQNKLISPLLPNFPTG